MDNMKELEIEDISEEQLLARCGVILESLQKSHDSLIVAFKSNDNKGIFTEELKTRIGKKVVISKILIANTKKSIDNVDIAYLQFLWLFFEGCERSADTLLDNFDVYENEDSVVTLILKE